MLSGAGLLTMVQRGQDSDERKEAGAQIGERHARLARRTSGLAGHRHDARDALGNQIEAAFPAVGAGLAVAGDRRVNQTRVLCRERSVAEAEAVHDARTIVLDYDV